jgi:transposase InsO family protein
LRKKNKALREAAGRGTVQAFACAESFFMTLKRELETADGKYCAEEVRGSVFMYVEAYYNRVRLHSGTDYAVPDAFYCEQVA